MEQVYIINLKKREDRWQEISKNISENSQMLDIVRFEALEPESPALEPGWKFCALSHIAIVEMAKEKDLPFIMVMEDDTVISKNFDPQFSRILGFMKANLDQWDIFNGNASCLNEGDNSSLKVICPFPIIVQIGFGKTTNFMIYNRSSYDRVIALKERYLAITKQSNYAQNAYDRLVCDGMRIITSVPYLTTQLSGYSDIEGRMVNYAGCFTSMGINIIINKIRGKYVFPKLNGGLGNQMFQIACAYGIARDSNSYLVIDPNNYTPCEYRDVNEYWNTYLDFLKPFLPLEGRDKHLRITDEFGYQQIVKDVDRLSVGGCLQNLGYFDRYRKEIQNLFKPKPATIKFLKEKYPWLEQENKVMIHVRRGDYVIKKNFHHNVPKQYYTKCMAKYTDHVFVVFSDDLEWCKEHIPANYYIREKDYVELQMMTLFDKCILANSTFSWWGAYLGNATDVSLPFRWLENGKYPDGLLLEGWRKVEY